MEIDYEGEWVGQIYVIFQMTRWVSNDGPAVWFSVHHHYLASTDGLRWFSAPFQTRIELLMVEDHKTRQLELFLSWLNEAQPSHLSPPRQGLKSSRFLPNLVGLRPEMPKTTPLHRAMKK